ncbi:MAG: molybdopterin-dependent oxidoreductase [Coriobacteriaceae bacterium]
MGMTLCFGQGRGAHDTRDYMNSNMVVLWGRNVADTHTSEFRYLVKARENGAKIVVVDPRLCSTAAIADEWIPIKAQTDPALALGMMNVIISNTCTRRTGSWLTPWRPSSCASPMARCARRRGRGRRLDGVDTAAGKAVPNTTEGVTAALSGTFEVNGETCRTAFDHLCDEVSKYTLEYTRDPGLDPEVIENFAMDYINVQPAGIRMGQGMQRVYNSHSPFRTVATLAAVAGYIGVEGGGASHAGGTASIRSTPGVTIPAFNYDEWADTGANEVNMVKSSTLYDQIIIKQPNPIDFMWFANSTSST